MGKSGFHFAALVKSDQRLGCSLAARAQHGSGRGRDCVQWHKERGLGGRAGAAGLGTVVPSLGILQVPVCVVVVLILPSLIRVNRTHVHNENKQAGLENIMSQEGSLGASTFLNPESANASVLCKSRGEPETWSLGSPNLLTLVAQKSIN